MSLEGELHEAMLEAYQRAGREAGYWGNYFLRSVRAHGGLVTARRMLRPLRARAIPKGLQALIDARRPDLSLEALVLNARFSRLFTAEELREARKRLSGVPDYALRRRIPPENIHPETMLASRKYTAGAVRRVIVNAYERDAGARKACLQRYGTRCTVCDMDFEERYGSIGKDFIHVHHKKPLATARQSYRLDPVKDLVPVCPNLPLHASYERSTPDH